MSDVGPATVAELRGELEDLRRKQAETDRRIDELESRLEARLAAAESKQAGDHTQTLELLGGLNRGLAELRREVASQKSGQRADTMAMMHLLGVTARKVLVPEEEIQRAYTLAEALKRGTP